MLESKYTMIFRIVATLKNPYFVLLGLYKDKYYLYLSYYIVATTN